MRRSSLGRLRGLLLLAACVDLLACTAENDNSITPSATPAVSLAGGWELRTANGQLLPFAVSSFGGADNELVSQAISVAIGGRFDEVTQIRTTVNGLSTISSSLGTGTISVTGTVVTMITAGSGSTIGALTSDTSFTIVDPMTNALFVFTKQ